MADEEDRENRPDKRVVQMLAQVKDHYRNPLVTPENVVEIDDATQFFGMAGALIALMARRIRAGQSPEARSTGKATAALAAAAEGDEDNYEFRSTQQQAG